MATLHDKLVHGGEGGNCIRNFMTGKRRQRGEGSDTPNLHVWQQHRSALLAMSAIVMLHQCKDKDNQVAAVAIAITRQRLGAALCRQIFNNQK